MVLADQADREAGWLRPLALLNVGLMVQVAFFATARNGKRSVRFQINSPELVCASHSHDQGVFVNSDDVPRRC